MAHWRLNVKGQSQIILFFKNRNITDCGAYKDTCRRPHYIVDTLLFTVPAIMSPQILLAVPNAKISLPRADVAAGAWQLGKEPQGASSAVNANHFVPGTSFDGSEDDFVRFRERRFGLLFSHAKTIAYCV